MSDQISGHFCPEKLIYKMNNCIIQNQKTYKSSAKQSSLLYEFLLQVLKFIPPLLGTENFLVITSYCFLSHLSNQIGRLEGEGCACM